MSKPLLAALLLAAAAAAPAAAAEVPICAQPEVLRLVAERLSRTGQPVVVQAAPVGQQPGLRPDTVQCAAYVHTPAVNTPKFAGQVFDSESVYSFTLSLRRNGVFLEAPEAR